MACTLEARRPARKHAPGTISINQKFKRSLVEPALGRRRAPHGRVAAAEEGGVSAAARGVNLSVQAMTRPVSALGRDLGVRLLDRSTQGLALTARGAQHLERPGASRRLNRGFM